MFRERAATMIEHQADSCARLGSPLYAALLRRVAHDVRDGGPCADAIAGYENAPGPDAIALRLLGGVHALTLTGRAPDLASYYPSTGGTVDPERPDACWPAFQATVAAELDWIRDWMTRPPQTNEVGRANLLITGLLAAAPAAPLPIRLFELGASAGLNLRADEFRYVCDEVRWGPERSPVVLDGTWRDTAPDWLAAAAAEYPRLAVVERRGCDLNPIDPESPAGTLALRAYVWPDQPARATRLEGALRLAARRPAEVRTVGAAEFLADLRLVPDTLTVVWHSVMRQYVPAVEWARVERELDRLAAASTATARFAHLAFEPHRVGDRYRFQLAVRLDGDPRRVLAEALPHGMPAWIPGDPGGKPSRTALQLQLSGRPPIPSAGPSAYMNRTTVGS